MSTDHPSTQFSVTTFLTRGSALTSSYVRVTGLLTLPVIFRRYALGSTYWVPLSSSPVSHHRGEVLAFVLLDLDFLELGDGGRGAGPARLVLGAPPPNCCPHPPRSTPASASAMSATNASHRAERRMQAGCLAGGPCSLLYRDGRDRAVRRDADDAVVVGVSDEQSFVACG